VQKTVYFGVNSESHLLLPGFPRTQGTRAFNILSMAHSPIPMSSIMHQSPSPLFNPQPLTKRDKKRQAVEQRIKEISDTFAAQRESHLRNQLNALHRDIQFVNRAEVYTNKPLDEIADDVFSDIASQQGSVDGESKAPALGRLAAEFVEDVNDALEERDASITATHVRICSSDPIPRVLIGLD